MAKLNSSTYIEKTTIADDDRVYGIDSEVVDPTTTEPVKYWKKSTLSEAVQDDLMANDAVTEATVATDTIPILVSSANKNITMQNLMIQMKGYKEYTFAIRQSGTDAPTISVIKDDFGLETPLVFTYSAVGVYRCDITALGLTLGNGVNVLGGYNRTAISAGQEIIESISHTFQDANTFFVYSTKSTNGSNVSIDGLMTNSRAITYSLRQTLT